jgi:hypothetical protein
MTMPEGVVDLRDWPRPDVVSAFSVDVEDYFHVEAFRGVVDPNDWASMEQRVEPNTRRLLDLLDEFDVSGTFFVLGWVAERRPELVRDILSAGHAVGIHGYDHRPITAMTPQAFREDIRRAKGIVEDVTGEAVLGYRAPTYSVVKDTLWALDVMLEEGCGTTPRCSDRPRSVRHRRGTAPVGRAARREPTSSSSRSRRCGCSDGTCRSWAAGTSGCCR